MWGVWIYDLDGKGGGWWIDTTGAVWGTADQLHAEVQAIYLSERAHRVATARQFGEPVAKAQAVPELEIGAALPIYRKKK